MRVHTIKDEMQRRGDWKVLLIGGGSSVGKTTLARQIAASTGATLTCTDERRSGDVEAVLRDATTWQQPPETIVELLEGAGDAFAATLAEIVASSLVADGRFVIEGERITPPAAAAVASPQSVAFFLVEPSERQLRSNLTTRPGVFASLDPQFQAKVAHVDWLLGQRIEQDAQRVGLPVLYPRPWTTLDDRAKGLLHLHREASVLPL